MWVASKLFLNFVRQLGFAEKRCEEAEASAKELDKQVSKGRSV